MLAFIFILCYYVLSSTVLKGVDKMKQSRQPREFFKIISGNTEIVAYTWDEQSYQVDTIDLADNFDYCEGAFISESKAIAYAQKIHRRIETVQLKEKALVLIKKNQKVNNKIVGKLLTLAVDTACSYGELKNAVLKANMILNVR